MWTKNVLCLPQYVAVPTYTFAIKYKIFRQEAISYDITSDKITLGSYVDAEGDFI